MRKKGLNGVKSEKNRRIVGGWRIGPISIKNRPRKKEEKKTKPVQKKFGPVRFTQNLVQTFKQTPHPFASAFFFFPHSCPASSSPNPETLDPESPQTPMPISLAPLSLYLVIILFLPRSLSSSTTPQPTEFPKPRTPSTHGFLQNRNHPIPPTHPPPLTTTKPRPTFAGFILAFHARHPNQRSRFEGGFGYKARCRRHWRESGSIG